MATQRYISTSFWNDPWVQTLTPTEKFLYLYLLTNPLTNIAGVYEITERRMIFDTSLTSKQIRGALSKFGKAKKAVKYQNWIILPAWPSHQRYDKSDRIRKGIETILELLPSELLGVMDSIGYRYPIDTLSSPVIYPSNYKDIDSDLDSDSDVDSDSTQTGSTRSRFTPPSVEEVRAYCKERKNAIDAERFVDYYTANGWMRGKNKIKDWRACIRTWEKNQQGHQPDPEAARARQKEEERRRGEEALRKLTRPGFVEPEDRQ